MSEHTEPQHFVSNLYNVLMWNFSVFPEPTYDFLEWNSSGDIALSLWKKPLLWAI